MSGTKGLLGKGLYYSLMCLFFSKSGNFLSKEFFRVSIHIFLFFFYNGRDERADGKGDIFFFIFK